MNTQVLGSEAAMHDVSTELTKVGFTLVTVNPGANTMLMEYFVMNTTGSVWAKESFTTEIAGLGVH